MEINIPDVVKEQALRLVRNHPRSVVYVVNWPPEEISHKSGWIGITSCNSEGMWRAYSNAPSKARQLIKEFSRECLVFKYVGGIEEFRAVQS
jgi:hypothetical protein